MLVSGALDQTKRIRKAAADIFADCGAGKPRKDFKKLNCSPDVSSTLRGVCVNRPESTYKRLGPMSVRGPPLRVRCGPWSRGDAACIYELAVATMSSLNVRGQPRLSMNGAASSATNG